MRGVIVQPHQRHVAVGERNRLEPRVDQPLRECLQAEVAGLSDRELDLGLQNTPKRAGGLLGARLACLHDVGDDVRAEFDHPVPSVLTLKALRLGSPYGAAEKWLPRFGGENP